MRSPSRPRSCLAAFCGSDGAPPALGCHWNLISVHNVAACRVHLDVLSNVIRQATDSNEVVILGGDLNLGEPDGEGITVDDSGCVETFEHINERRRWRRVLGHMVVAHHGRATRAVLEATAFGKSRISHSSLDRLYFNFKPAALHRMQLIIHVCDVSLAVRRAGPRALERSRPGSHFDQAAAEHTTTLEACASVGDASG